MAVRFYSAMMVDFAGFECVDVAGIPVLTRIDRRFKTFRIALYARRPLDDRAAARALLPGLLMQGTRIDRDRPALARRMHELYGAAVQPMTSKLGESHLLGFALDSVSGEHLPGRPDLLTEGLALLADLIVRPQLDGEGFGAATFERERRQQANAIRTMIDDKGGYAHERAIELACAGEPMAIPEHGGLDAVLRLTREVPEAARRDFLQRGQMWAIAMGDLPDAATCAARMGELLGALPERSPEPVGAAIEVEPREPRHVIERAELRQSKLVLVFRAPRLAESAARVSRGLAVSIFGGGPNSRLFTEVREKRSLAYYASATADRHKGLLLVQVGLDADRAAEAETEILRQLALLQQGDFEDRELETARHGMLAALASVDDSIAARVRFTSEQWLQASDRTPESVAAMCRAASRSAVVDAAQGIWIDHSYLLADASVGASA